MERDLGSLILATDISRQNEYLSRFRIHLDQQNLCLSNASHRHFILQVWLTTSFAAKMQCLIPKVHSYLVFLPYRWPWSVRTSVTPADPGSWANSGVKKWLRSSSSKVLFFFLLLVVDPFYLFSSIVFVWANPVFFLYQVCLFFMNSLGGSVTLSADYTKCRLVNVICNSFYYMTQWDYRTLKILGLVYYCEEHPFYPWPSVFHSIELKWKSVNKIQLHSRTNDILTEDGWSLSLRVNMSWPCGLWREARICSVYM